MEEKKNWRNSKSKSKLYNSIDIIESFIHKQQTSTPILILGTCFLVLLVHFFYI